ncbi:MAG TPA: hypothetical protein DIW81_25630, partial [Planctomycetaceae bacterium]|nr:hypothetical protein [Planctomycetaceae bacterium]
SVTQYETFFEGTLDLADPASLAAGTTTVIDLDGNPVTSGPVSWSSSASGNGLFEVITEAFDVDEDGTIEEGEQQATTRIESYDDYDSDSSVAGAGVFTSYLLDVIATDEDNTDPDLDINTSGWETYWESGYLQTIEEAHGFVDLEITDTQTTETDWEDELAE